LNNVELAKSNIKQAEEALESGNYRFSLDKTTKRYSLNKMKR